MSLSSGLTLRQICYGIFVPMLLIGCISHSVVYGEIRLATDSVLPALIMHTISNFIGNVLLINGTLQYNSGQEQFFSIGVEGIISIIVMLAIGYWLHLRRVNIE